MTLPQKKRKVKRKKRVIRQKVHFSSQGPKQRKKKRTKKPLVLNTNSRVKKLQKEVAALKRKIRAQEKAKRKRKPKRSKREKITAEPGAILSERSEAARRGWSTRRANKAKKIAAEQAAQMLTVTVPSSAASLLAGERPDVARFIDQVSTSEAEQQQLLEFADKIVKNKQNIVDTFVQKLPEYLIRGDEILVERKDNLIMLELIKADQITGDFDTRAYDLAEEYDLDPHEVYSLWHGYELEE
jgi:hypothetical protein